MAYPRVRPQTDVAVIEASQDYLQKRGYIIFPPPKPSVSAAGQTVTERIENWTHSQSPQLRKDMLPVIQMLMERIRQKQTKEIPRPETRIIKMETHAAVMDFVGQCPEILELLGNVTFCTHQGPDVPNLPRILGRPDFPYDWPAINERPINCAIQNEHHIRQCTTSVKRSLEPQDWTANNFAARASLPLPPTFPIDPCLMKKAQDEGSTEESKNDVWVLQDMFSDTTSMARNSRWNACGMQSMEGNGAFVWKNDPTPSSSSKSEEGCPMWRLNVGVTYTVAFDHVRTKDTNTGSTSYSSPSLLITGGKSNLLLWEISDEKTKAHNFGKCETWDSDWTWFGSYFCSAHHGKVCLWSTNKTVPIRVLAAKEASILDRAHVDVCRFHPTTNYLAMKGLLLCGMFELRNR